MTKDDDIICISCSIFKRELESLKTSGRLEYPVRFLDSMLHMNPKLLQQELEKAIKEELDKGKRIIVIFGDCHSHMIDMEKHPDIVRTNGINCCEIMLGKEEYQTLRKEGYFFLMPEWSVRWKEIFQVELGMTKENMKDLMKDTRGGLMYLDSGLEQVPENTLMAISDYCGLDYEIRNTSLDHLAESIDTAADELKRRR